MYLESYENLQGSSPFYVSDIIVGIGSWSFQSYLKKYYVRLDVKRECYTLQGSQKIKFGATHLKYKKFKPLKLPS